MKIQIILLEVIRLYVKRNFALKSLLTTSSNVLSLHISRPQFELHWRWSWWNQIQAIFTLNRWFFKRWMSGNIWTWTKETLQEWKFSKMSFLKLKYGYQNPILIIFNFSYKNICVGPSFAKTWILSQNFCGLYYTALYNCGHPYSLQRAQLYRMCVWTYILCVSFFMNQFYPLVADFSTLK